VRFHARGGLGEVHVGLDQELRRVVALKRIRKPLADHPECRRRFLREAEITGRLEHPGIVPVYGLVTDEDGQSSYAMRFIQGESLKEAIQRFHEADQRPRDPGERSLALRELLNRFVSVCKTLAYAHSRGIIHRDLKPANIMLGPYGETLVVDWGLARPVGQAEAAPAQADEMLAPTAEAGTQIGDLLGSPPYMSPEQAAGRWDVVGPASDLYALGATLYTLLTGRVPVSGNDIEEISRKVRQGDFPPPRQLKPETPAALEAVCLRAMALRPEDRYATALGLAADLENWLADEPPAAYREPLSARVSRWGRRHKPLVVGLAAALLVGLAALGVGLFVVAGKNGALAQANADLVAANESEKQAREREKKAKQDARQAFEDMMSEESLKFLETAKELRPEQRAFLQRAVAYYQRFADEDAEDEGERARQAKDYYHVGLIQRRLGLLPEAAAAYRQAIAAFARLTEGHPDVTAYRKDLGRSHNNLANVLRDQGKREDAAVALRAALKEQQRLIDDHPDVPNYRNELARSHINLGNLLRDLGESAKAEAEYNTALQELQRLAEGHPTVPDYRRLLALSHTYLGDLLRARGERAKAEAEFRASLAGQQRLTEEHPAAPNYRWDLASSHINLGRLLAADPRKFPEAESEYRAALKTLQRLTEEHPTVTAYRKELALNHLNLGVLLKNRGEPQKAEAEYAAALREYQRLAEDETSVPGYQQGIARCHGNLGILLAGQGKPAEAEAEFRTALKDFERLVEQHPAVPEYRNDLAGICVNLALFLRGKDSAEMRRLLEQALPHHQAALRANPNDLGYRRPYYANLATLAPLLLDQGDHAAAADTAGRLSEAALNPVNDVYNAACYLARCGPLAEKDDKLPEAKRKELAQSYGDRALALLRQAVQNGYKDITHLKEDKDLDSLRRREDFQRLLGELEAKHP
jgi:serine/threonine-protein kinase